MRKKNLIKVKALTDKSGLVVGNIYSVNSYHARVLVANGNAEYVDKEVGVEKPKAPEQPKEKQDSELTFNELKAKYPHIKAKSKVKFLEELAKECEGCTDDAPCEGCEKSAETTNLPVR